MDRAGEHDLYGHEFCVYDPLVNVPLLIKHPELDADPGETENLAQGDDPEIAATESTLAGFESAVGGAWTDAFDGEVSDDTVEEMDDEARERLRDLGYLE